MNTLSLSWVLQKVTVNDKDVTLAFKGLVLTLSSDRTFTVSNPIAPLWPENGIFSLEAVAGSQHYMIKRNDGIDMWVEALTSNTLQLQFNYLPPGDRTAGANGQYAFVFRR